MGIATGIGIGIGFGGSGGMGSPSNFAVTLLSPNGTTDQTARLSWDVSAVFETEIYCSVNGGAAALLTTVAVNIGTYDDVRTYGIECELAYYARFKNDTTVLSVPTGFGIAVIAGGIRLTCDAVTDADHYEWYANIDGSGSSLLTTTVNPTYDHTIQAFDIKYKVRAKEGTAVYSSFTAEETYSNLNVLNLASGDEYGFKADNGALDIGADASDFTMTCKVKCLNKTASTYLVGKAVSGAVAGRYGVYINITTGYLTAIAQSSTSTATINSAVDGTTGWKFLRLDVNKATSVVRFFIDEIQIGADSAFTGTFSGLANTYEFYIGAGNSSDGSAVALITKAQFSEVQIFRRLLSAGDITKAQNGQLVANPKARWLCNAYPITDTTGVYNLTGVNLDAGNIIAP
jgi:hypothetical protein